jgi:hypothetical protein
MLRTAEQSTAATAARTQATRRAAVTRRKWIFVLHIALAIGGYAALPLVDPLRRSDESIRESLLKETPPGTKEAAVQALIKARGWRRCGGTVRARDEMVWSGVGTELGQYRGLLLSEVSVWAVWQFDRQGTLIDIEVTTHVLSL